MTLDDLGLRDPSLHQMLGHLSHRLAACSFLLRDILMLRLTVVVTQTLNRLH